MEHIQESNIKCPNCEYEYMDSWEYEESGIETCLNCEEDFYLQIELTYTTLKIISLFQGIDTQG